MATPPIRPPHQQALSITPLNSMPYIVPLTTEGNGSPLEPQVDPEPQGDAQPAEKANPALIYLPSQPAKEELSNILSVSKSAVVLGGCAAAGAIGPVIGKKDIADNEDSYIFRVALPGVAKEGFSIDATADGNILIKGVTTTGEKTVYKHSMKFEMLTQNLCPPGHFSISFKLPGSIYPEHLSGILNDGMFEGSVPKRILPN